MKFDFKTAKYNRFYLINLWAYLYFMNSDAALYDSEVSIFFKSLFLKKIYRINFLQVFGLKNSSLSFQEIKWVSESLSTFSLDDLLIMEIYIQTIRLDDHFYSALKFIGRLIQKLAVFIFTIFIGYKLIPSQDIVNVISKIGFWEGGVSFLILMSVMFIYIRVIFSDLTYEKKRREIENIFPKLLDRAIDTKKNELRIEGES
ncbi:hypothetical protein [Streptococcus pluranimalium]